MNTRHDRTGRRCSASRIAPESTFCSRDRRLSTLHSQNPYCTALFCTVPPNRIFLGALDSKKIRDQKSKVRNPSTFPSQPLPALFNLAQVLQIPLFPGFSRKLSKKLSLLSQSTFALAPYADRLLHRSFSAIRDQQSKTRNPLFTFVSPCIHDFHAKKLSARRATAGLPFLTQVPAFSNFYRLNTSELRSPCVATSPCHRVIFRQGHIKDSYGHIIRTPKSAVNPLTKELGSKTHKIAFLKRTDNLPTKTTTARIPNSKPTTPRFAKRTSILGQHSGAGLGSQKT
jgi:hypothetical protein